MTTLSRTQAIVQGFPANGRIAIFLHHLGGGGVERSMVNIMHELVRLGIAVDLVIVTLTGPYVSQLPSQIRVIDLKQKRVAKAILPLARYLRREKPLALLTALMHANVAAILARKLARSPARVAISERNYPSVWFSRGPHPRLVRLCNRLRPWAYRQADVIIAVSHGVGDDLARITGIARDRITTVYNPVVTPQLIARSHEAIGHPWFAAGQPPVILGVGRFIHLKNFPLLVRAFERVRRQQHARLVILGEGELRPDLEALVHQLNLQEDVLLPGFVDNPYAWMRQSKAFVLSSDTEGLGNVLVEAMACGTPVIATDCPSGPGDVLQQGKVGKLVPMNDVDAMAQALMQTLNTPPETAPLIERARAFSSDVITRQYLQLLVPGVRFDS